MDSDNTQEGTQRISPTGEQDAQAEPTGATEADRYNTLGITQATQNMGLQAIASFTRAIELDPDNPGYYYNRGIVHANDSSLAMALQDFTRALELRGEDADILN